MHATMPKLIFLVFSLEIGFHQVGQAGLELLTSGDPLASASQSVGITVVSHCAQLVLFILSNGNHLPFFHIIGSPCNAVEFL